MNILLTNDDGICADGLWALYRRFIKKHKVVVVAPDRERSAVGHGISLNRPLRTARFKADGGCKGFAVSGTPVDCVKLGILELLDVKPDMVISGINAGANVGVNINYSGTVSAAKEAALYGIASIAASLSGRNQVHLEEAARFVEMLAEAIWKHGLPAGTLLNVNFPDKPSKEISGVRINRHGTTFFSEYVEKRIDPRSRTYYWHGSYPMPSSDDLNIDETALSRNYISITPIKCDMTDYTAMEAIKDWKIDEEIGK